MDERAGNLHITATIIDLAVRGYLTIEQVVKPRKTKKESNPGDWEFVKLTDQPRKQLRGYESALYSAIFVNGRTVRLSRLRHSFKTDLLRVRGLLESDVTSQGWFRELPSKVRRRWVGYGLVTIVVGVGLTWALAAVTVFGLLGVAVVLAGIVVLLLSRHTPARSARGTAVLARTRGFRLYLEKAEANQIRFEEGEDVFSRYLPFAIIFGVAERWAAVFATLAAGGAAVATPNWYDGSAWATAAAFDFVLFSESLDNFSGPTSSSLSTSPVSAARGEMLLVKRGRAPIPRGEMGARPVFRATGRGSGPRRRPGSGWPAASSGSGVNRHRPRPRTLPCLRSAFRPR
jgi:Predicted membrane protein (DUF2207)